jgi:hypothetical protein
VRREGILTYNSHKKHTIFIRRLKTILWRKKLHNTQTEFGNSKTISQICTHPKTHICKLGEILCRVKISF